MKVTVIDVVDSMEFEWLWSGPMVDACEEDNFEAALDHLDMCLASVCYFDFDTGQELKRPHTLTDGIRDYPELVARAKQEWEAAE